MTFYGGLKSVASSVLADKGQNLTFSREGDTAFDPKTGISTTTPTSFTGYGASFNYNTKEIDGSLIQNGDIKLLLEATATAPITGDQVTIDSIIYRVVNIKTTSPAGEIVVYNLQLRR